MVLPEEGLVMRTKIRLRQIWLLLALTIVATQIAQAGGDRYPVFVDCPDRVTGSHCDTFFVQVRAENPDREHPNNANIRYHLITGPGEIDERTGWWQWKWSPGDSLHGFMVEIAASIGNSHEHMTPPDEYCLFTAGFQDNPSVIRINGKPSNSVFFVTAPGVHYFDIEIEDPDECDSPHVEILGVQPAVGGAFYIENDQLVFAADAVHDDKKFVVTLVNRGSPRIHRQNFIFDTRDNPVPIFEDCPGDIATTHCDRVTERVKVVDPNFSDLTGITLELVSGPGRIMAQRYWYYIPTEADVGQTYEVEIAARYGDITTAGDENCQFSVSVEENVPGMFSIGFTCGDSVVIPELVPSIFRLRAFDDDCRTLTVSVADISPPFAGDITVSGGNRRPRYDWETHQLNISPDSADLGQTFHLTLEGSSSTELYNCDLTFTVEPARPYRVRIETLRNVVQGQYAHLDVVLEEANIPLGSFDFAVAYDASVIAPLRATPGDFLNDCGWEYLTWDFGPFGPWVDGVPTGQMRIKAIATVPRGSTPSCFLPDHLPTTLFTIDLMITNDRTYECTWVPVQFYWQSCNDNMIRPPMYRGSILSKDVYDSDGNLLASVDSLPTFAGAPDDCLHDPKNYPRHRLIDFYSGGIDIICADSISSIGDINLNGVAYEVADAVLFTNYFVYGEGVFIVNPEMQAAASDVNGDGELLTIEDFQWLIAVIWGVADPHGPPEPSPNPAIFRQAADGSVEVLTPDTLGAAWMVFDGDVNPTLSAQAMEMRYAYNGSTTRVLIYSLGTNSFPAGSLLSNVTAPLVEVQTCTYNGAKVEAIIDQALGADGEDENNLPESFALAQNFPNPFNSQTLVQFDLPHASEVTFSVYNILGKIVYQRTQYYPGGRHELVWDGCSMSGRDAATGIYFYRLKAGTFTSTKKMILLR